MMLAMPSDPRGTGASARRIALAGWFGFGNVGDDLIMMLLNKHAAPTVTFSTQAIKSHGITLRHIDDIEREQHRFDVLLVGGGGLLYKRYVDMLGLERLPETFGFLSVGIPHRDWLEGLESVVERASFVTLRDPRAIRMFTDAFPGVPCSLLPDPAFLLAQEEGRTWRPRRRHRRRGKPKILINVRFIPKHWLRPTDPPDAVERQIEGINAIIDKYRDRADFVGIGFDPKDERVLPELQCPSSILEPVEAVRAIRGADGIVATRLHASIIAAAVGTPSVMVEYQDKVGGLAELLGRQDDLIPLEDPAGVARFIEERLDAPDRRASQEQVRAFAARVATFLRDPGPHSPALEG